MTAVRVVLGHGASGTAASMRPWVDGLRAHGLDAAAIDLPRGRTDAAVAVFEKAIVDASGAPSAEADGGSSAEAAGAGSSGEAGGAPFAIQEPPPAATAFVVAGGHSFGGRVASLAAARLFDDTGRVAAGRVHGDRVAGLLLLSYPLHRPGDPDGWRERTAHWPSLRCPVLLLSGESDPFARLGLLREAVALLPNGRLVAYPRVGHGLRPVFDDAFSEAAAFLASIGRP